MRPFYLYINSLLSCSRGLVSASAISQGRLLVVASSPRCLAPPRCSGKHLSGLTYKHAACYNSDKTMLHKIAGFASAHVPSPSISSAAAPTAPWATLEATGGLQWPWSPHCPLTGRGALAQEDGSEGQPECARHLSVLGTARVYWFSQGS